MKMNHGAFVRLVSIIANTAAVLLKFLLQPSRFTQAHLSLRATLKRVVNDTAVSFSFQCVVGVRLTQHDLLFVDVVRRACWRVSSARGSSRRRVLSSRVYGLISGACCYLQLLLCTVQQLCLYGNVIAIEVPLSTTCFM